VSEIEDQMTGLELAEWMAYDGLNAQVAELVRGGIDPVAADRTVWQSKDEG